MKTEQEISKKYEEFAKRKTALIKERDSFPGTFNLRIEEINAKMSVIDWLFGDIQDV